MAMTMATAVENTTVDTMTVAGHPLFHRRIEFHLARRPYTGVPLSTGDFRLETLNPDSSEKGRAGAGSGVGFLSEESLVPGRRSAGGESRERDLDPELSFRISFQKIGAGLENLGNTCYLNSVLQCLTYTEPFAAYLQSGKHKSTCRAAGFCVLCALQNHVMDALQSTGKILKPFHLVRNLRCISRSFRNARQEDAHEYMVNLLESMHRCCLPYGVPSESPSAFEKSLVHKIFGGQLRSQVKCMQCSHCSNKFDPFLDLSLEIVGADSLGKALTNFTTMEQLDDGDRQYQCQHCKEKVKALKQLTIHKAPYVLSIHLKRFGSCIRGEKINKKIEFERTLDLKPFVSGLHEEELKYTLYGVLVHAGWSTHSGHYFCYVRTSAGLWYSLDDNHVSQVGEKTVLSREAYMLFYVRDRNNIKRSFEILKTDTSTNSSGNKGTPLAERILNTPDYNSSKVRHDGVTHGLTVSRKYPLSNQETLVQSNGHAITTGSCFQVCEDVLSNGVHKEILPKDKSKILVSVNSRLPSFGAKANCSDMKTCSTSQQCQVGREKYSKFVEPKPVELLNLNKLVSSLQVESPTVPEIENLMDSSQQIGVMLKKSKISLSEGYRFGRKQLFLMSLKLHNKKRKKEKKKQHQSCRNKTKKKILDMCTDSQGASTSETCRSVDMCSSFGKDLYSTSGKKSMREEGDKSGNDSCQMNYKEIHLNSTSGNLPGTYKESNTSLKFKNANDKEILQTCPMSLLKASLKEATVAKWDIDDLRAPQIHDLEDAPKGKVGYLLDEWDEEYDRGKRKKRKLKHQPLFDGPNPFQETAELKMHHKMMIKNQVVQQTTLGTQSLLRTV